MVKLNSNEILVTAVRKHWLVFLLDHLYLLVLAIVPLVFAGLLPSVILDLGLSLYRLWLLGLWMALAIAWTNYYLDVWYLTDERLIDIDQKGLFLRNEATLSLAQIQDITIETGGILGTLFGFGTIVVQTAGESREFKMRHVINPEQVKEKIHSLARDFAARPQKVTL